MREQTGTSPKILPAAVYASNKKDKEPFETLRSRAEADVAARTKDGKPQSRRPSWAPPMVLSGELLEVCIKLELLSPMDLPFARLWGQFANPKKVGRTLREVNRDRENAMVGVACRGFEFHVGSERGNRFDLLLEAQRRVDGSWRVGPQWISPRQYDQEVERAKIDVRSRQWYVDAHPSIEFYAETLADAQRKLAIAEAKATGRYDKALARYELRRRATELAAIRVAEFAGDQDAQMQIAGRLCGHCSQCFRELTDPKSLEIGIGPECVQHVLVRGPEGLMRMVDAIADGRIAAVDGRLRWVA
jgi:hypothetical protein